MLSKKEKQHTKRLKTIRDLCDELVYLDANQKWFVDQVTDGLRTMNKYECTILINRLNHRISVRR